MILIPSLFLIAIYFINVLYYINSGATFFAILMSLFFTGTITALAIGCGYDSVNILDRKFLVDNGRIHVKTDSNFLATYTKCLIDRNGLPIDFIDFDIYAPDSFYWGHHLNVDRNTLCSIQTYYERMWLERGIPIKYLLFRLPHDKKLVEPDVEIPVDDYRSYGHEVRSTRTVSK